MNQNTTFGGMTGKRKTLMGKPMNLALKLITSALAVCLLLASGVSLAAEPAPKELGRRFSAEVQPFLKTYCLDCHGKEKQEGKLNLAGYDSLAAVAKNQQIWELVLERLKGKEMPPEDAPRVLYRLLAGVRFRPSRRVQHRVGGRTSSATLQSMLPEPQSPPE